MMNLEAIILNIILARCIHYIKLITHHDYTMKFILRWQGYVNVTRMIKGKLKIIR